MSLRIGGGRKLLDQIKALMRAQRRGEVVTVAQVESVANQCYKHAFYNHPSPRTVEKWRRLLHETCVVLTKTVDPGSPEFVRLEDTVQRLGERMEAGRHA